MSEDFELDASAYMTLRDVVFKSIRDAILSGGLKSGERLMEKSQAEGLYSAFGKAYRTSENWKLYILSSHTEFERTFGKNANKKRKLYNGMIKCDLFMYL